MFDEIIIANELSLTWRLETDEAAFRLVASLRPSFGYDINGRDCQVSVFYCIAGGRRCCPLAWYRSSPSRRDQKCRSTTFLLAVRVWTVGYCDDDFNRMEMWRPSSSLLTWSSIRFDWFVDGHKSILIDLAIHKSIKIWRLYTNREWLAVYNFWLINFSLTRYL